MTIQECIKKTVEYLDEVYKDGPHFYITPDTPARQRAELADVYHHHLDLNLKALQRAYILRLEDEIYLDSNGWIAFPKIPDDAIETFETKCGNVKATIKIADVNGRFLFGYSVLAGPQYGTLTDCNIWSWYGLSRREAINSAINEFKKYICFAEERQKDKEFCRDLRKCIEHLEEFELDEQQGKLF